MNALSANVAAFCRVLRREHGFTIGQAEAHDALRAVETVGVDDEARVRAALRLVCCGSREQRDAFDRAFDAFFRPSPRGVAQPADAARHSRPATDTPPPAAERPAPRPPQPVPDGGDGAGGPAAERRASDEPPDDATAWQLLRARYSAGAAAAPPPLVSRERYAQMLAAAAQVIASVRLGRSRRWRRIERGGRFDLRRTIRASLQTGGDPVDLRYLGHPLRNPRFVVLIDGSRSMAEQTAAVMQFAHALCDRTPRASVFVFSTALRDITRELRDADAASGPLGDFGDAWGGGTKIGASLDDFVVEHGTRLLTPDTLVIVFSDGLDAGDLPRLERALRTVDRRSAALVWLNPHAATPGFAPTARGMRAALPFVTILTAANDAAGFTALAKRIATHPRIAGRRR